MSYLKKKVYKNFFGTVKIILGDFTPIHGNYIFEAILIIFRGFLMFLEDLDVVFDHFQLVFIHFLVYLNY